MGGGEEGGKGSFFETRDPFEERGKGGRVPRRAMGPRPSPYPKNIGINVAVSLHIEDPAHMARAGCGHLHDLATSEKFRHIDKNLAVGRSHGDQWSRDCGVSISDSSVKHGF